MGISHELFSVAHPTGRAEKYCHGGSCFDMGEINARSKVVAMSSRLGQRVDSQNNLGQRRMVNLYCIFTTFFSLEIRTG
jgi:hypothetical protein